MIPLVFVGSQRNIRGRGSPSFPSIETPDSFKNLDNVLIIKLYVAGEK